MKIGDYEITNDSLQFILTLHRPTKETARTKNADKTEVVGYFPTLIGAACYLIDHGVRRVALTNLVELAERIESLKTEVRLGLGENMPPTSATKSVQPQKVATSKMVRLGPETVCKSSKKKKVK
ncbi:MAG: hypothetical protein TUN42_04210 [Dehalogenimonas sp.]